MLTILIWFELLKIKSTIIERNILSFLVYTPFKIEEKKSNLIL